MDDDFPAVFSIFLQMQPSKCEIFPATAVRPSVSTKLQKYVILLIPKKN